MTVLFKEKKCICDVDPPTFLIIIKKRLSNGWPLTHFLLLVILYYVVGLNNMHALIGQKNVTTYMGYGLDSSICNCIELCPK